MNAPSLDEDASRASLRATTRDLLDRAHVPFSKAPTAAIALLGDGTWIPGVRVESASFSLTIPALLNAYTTAVACGRADDVRALVLSRPLQRGEEAYVSDLPGGPWRALADDTWTCLSPSPSADAPGRLPRPTRAFDPMLQDSSPANRALSGAEGIERARDVAARAYVPASEFPVGAILETTDGRLVPGVNVEHPDWSRILCAERNAVGTAYAYGKRSARRLFLTCANDPEGTPCGACRQVLAELTPEAALWMDRHDDAPERAQLSDLLPGSFRGQALLS